MLKRLRKRLSLTIIALLLIAMLFFLLRGPYLSNSIKRVVIPVLENATKERIIIDSAVINLFPFYIQAKGLKMFDKEGNRLLWITKTRAYMDLISLLSNEVVIRKLSFKEPELTADEESLRRIIENIKETGSSEGGKKARISLNDVEMIDGNFNIKNKKGILFIGDGLFFEMTAKNYVTAQLKLNKGTVKTPDLTVIKSGLDMNIKIKDKTIEISDINIYAARSKLHAKGEVNLTSDGNLKDGRLTGNVKIYDDVIHKLYGLKTSHDSVLSLDGTVSMFMSNEQKQPRFSVDLKTDSRFYLETLREMLRIKENITGKLTVKGEITGTFPELAGAGKAELEEADLGPLRIDDAAGEIIYEDGKFSLKSFKAHTYEGEMQGEASLLLPHGDYAVTADVYRISSPKFLKFIRWEPPLPPGEVSGNFKLQHNHKQDIEVQAQINYLNTSGQEGDVLNRLHTASGNIYLKDGLLKLYNSVLSTSLSDLSLGGSIDIKKKIISLDLSLNSRDISDLTAPYYTRLVAPGKFKGILKGPFGDPEISGRVEAGSGSVNGMMFTNASADMTYKMSSLSVNRLDISNEASTYDASGIIEFRKPEKLFQFKEPYYSGKAVIKNADITPFIRMLYKEIPVSGMVSGMLSFEGDARNFAAQGDLLVKDSTVYGQQFGKITVKTTIHPENMEFQAIKAETGDSRLDAKGKLYFDKRFDFSASSSRMNFSDISILERYSIGGTAHLNLNGSGTFEKPDISFYVDLQESTYKEVRTGKGKIIGALKGNELSASGNLMNGVITADAKAILSKKTLWNIDVDLHRGSYNILLSGLVKEIPKDLELSLEGKIWIKGEGGNISLLSRFGYLDCNIYGYNLRNNNDIVLELADKGFAIKAFSLIGDNVKISAGGIIKLNEEFDLKLHGNVDLAQFNNLSDRITSLKGSGNFVLDIKGPWDVPDIYGEVNVKDTMMLFNEYPYKIGPMNGTVYVKKDRFTFDSVRTVFGGGSISLSGVGYLKGFSVQRIFISSAFTGISIRPAEKFSAVVDGRLFYETSEKDSKVYGNIDIIRAKYEKNVELNKLLPGYRQISKDTFRYPEFLKDTEFNVYISGENNIIIDNNIAKTPVRISLTLTGNISRFGLVGRIEADEGDIYFRSKEFKMLEGSNVDFITPGRINPFFHLLAETYIGNYYVKLNLDGTMDKFTLSLFSDPPLTEMEILSLLTIGQSGKESKGFESGIAASEATSVLTGGLQDRLQENVKSITGIERFMIEPHTTAAGAVSPKVTIGKRLLEDKLFVTYSTSVGTTEESLIKLEYILDKNLSLIGSKDEIGSVGGDIKFRFEFK